MFDVIALGDTTVDVFLEVDEATLLCDINKDDCRICFDYAHKIPIKSVTEIKGVGNAANHAVGMSRLGFTTALYTILGDDDAGHEMYEYLTQEETVSDEYIYFDKKRGSNHSTVLNYKGERTILVFHEERTYVLPKFLPPKWFYLTSMAKGHEKFLRSFVKFVKKHNVSVAFNPGSFQIKMGLEGLREVFEVTTILFLNKHEAESLVGKTHDIKKLAHELHIYGPKVVVITDGPNGSYCFAQGNYYFLDVLDAPVVERTGCGDAYATGFVAAQLYGKNYLESMCWGNISATSVLQHIGAQKGLLSKKQMEKRFKDIKACHPQLMNNHKK